MANFETLEFEIKQTSNEAANGVAALTASLTRLRKVAGGMSSLSKVTQQLTALNRSLSGFRTDNLSKITAAFTALHKVGDLKISKDLSESIAALSGAMTVLNNDNIRTLNKLGASIRSISEIKDVPKLVPVAEQLTALNAVINQMNAEQFAQFAKALLSLSKTENIRIPEGLADSIARLGGSITILTDEGIQRLERMTEALQDMGRLRSVSFRAGQTASSQTQQTTPRTSGVEHLRSEIQETGRLMRESAEESRRFSQALDMIVTAGEAASAAINWVIGVIQVLISLLRRVASIVNKLLTPVKKVVTSIGKGILGSFAKIGTAIKDSVKGLGQFLDSLKRIAMYRLIRSMIAAMTRGMQEGINNLYQWSKLLNGSFAKAMDQIATSALYVKNSLAAMVAPLIERLAPVIDMIGDKLVGLLNKVNQTFAALMGQKVYTAAKKVEAEFAKIESHVIGIDELNIIGDDQPPVTEMFEKLPIETSITSFVDRLKEYFQEGDWEGLGRFLGGKINDLMDMIDWEKIGKTIGYYLNAIIKTAYYFLDEIDFMKAGSHIADLLNNVLESVEWEYLGRILVKKITIVWDFAIGFLKELDWGLVGKSLFDAITGILHELTEWFRKYDWVELGETLLQKLKDFIANFDFEQLIRDIFTLLGTAMKAIKDLLTPLWNSFVEWWNGHIKGKDFTETLKNLIDYLVDFVDKNIITPFMKAFTGDESMDKDASSMNRLHNIGENILGGILQGITNWLGDRFQEWLRGKLFGPFVSGIMWIFGIHSPAETMIPIGENIILGILEGMVLAMANLYSAITNFFTTIITVLGEQSALIIEAVGNFFVTVIDTITEQFTNIIIAIGDFFVTIIETITQQFANIIIAVGEFFVTIIETLTEQFANILISIGEFFTTIIETLMEQFSNILIALGEFFVTVIETVTQQFANVVTAVGELFVTILESATQGLSEILGAVSGGLTNIIGSISNGMSTIITSVSDTIGTVVKSIGEAIAIQLLVDRLEKLSKSSISTGSALKTLNERSEKVIATFNKMSETLMQLTVLLPIMSAMASVATSTLKALASAASDAASSLGELSAAAEIAAGAVGELSGSASGIGDTFTQAFASASQTLNDFMSSLSDMEFEFTVGVEYNDPGWTPPPDHTIHVNVEYNDPGFGGGHALGGIVPHATGSIITRPTTQYYKGQTHLFGEAGREAILPLDSYTGWMDEVAKRVDDRINGDDPEGISIDQAFANFFMGYLEPVLSEIAVDTKRQADKDERTVVKIGNRDIKNAYDTQVKADGYSFTGGR